MIGIVITLENFSKKLNSIISKLNDREDSLLYNDELDSYKIIKKMLIILKIIDIIYKVKSYISWCFVEKCSSMIDLDLLIAKSEEKVEKWF